MAAPVIVISGPVGAGKTTVSRLVAQCFERSVHVRLDDFMAFFVNGWIEPSRPEAAQQNDALGAAVASAAIRFADGEYTVVLDGHFFPEGVQEMAAIFAARSVPLHYAVLRAELDTCMARATDRGFDTEHFDVDMRAVADLHGRFADLGAREANVFDATRPAAEVAEAVLAAFRGGRLEITP